MINDGQFHRVTFAVGLAELRPDLRGRILSDLLAVAFATGRNLTQNKATRSMMLEAAIAIASKPRANAARSDPSGVRALHPCHPLRVGWRGSASRPGMIRRPEALPTELRDAARSRYHARREDGERFREVRPTGAAPPPRPDPETQTSTRRPEREPTAGTTCEAGPANPTTPRSGTPKLPQPHQRGAGPSLPGPLGHEPAERRKRAFPQSLRYPFRGTPEGIDDFVTSLLWPHVIENPLKPFVTLRRQGL